MTFSAGQPVPIRVLILAHTPPPLHGQSLMVELMLQAVRDEIAAGAPLELFHIDCRYSESLSSLGRPGFVKIAAAFRYAFQAVSLRCREKIDLLYYIPAPAKRASLWRDWIVLGLARPFFPKTVFHWHAVGLAPWLRERATALERAISRRLYDRADLSVVLTNEKREEAAYFRPHAIEVIPNGIPDPCPHFDAEVLPLRQERARALSPYATARLDGGLCLRLLFLSAATREKGVFDALAAWKEINRRLAANGSPDRCSLTVAGSFPYPEEEREFRSALEQARNELRLLPGEEYPARTEVRLVGHLAGAAKFQAFAEADLFLFPSRYPGGESFGLVLVEAAHFGLPCLSTQSLVGEKGLNPSFHRHIDFQANPDLAGEILSLVPKITAAAEIRAEARRKFSLERFGARMAAALGGRNGPSDSD